MIRHGSCSCGAVSYAIDGPLRALITCHCANCANDETDSFTATAARRDDLAISGDSALVWVASAESEHRASRGACVSCGDVVFWDAPARPTVSIGVATLGDASGLEVIAHIWVPERLRSSWPQTAPPWYPRGLSADVDIPWHA